MPPAPGVEPAPARGYAVPGSGHPQAVDGRMSARVAQFASDPAPRTATRFAALALLIHRRAEARGGRVRGVSRRGPRYIFFTHRPPTQHPEDHRPIFRLSMAHSPERRQAPPGAQTLAPKTPAAGLARRATHNAPPTQASYRANWLHRCFGAWRPRIERTGLPAFRLWPVAPSLGPPQAWGPQAAGGEYLLAVG